jgi:hypothetical protein
MLIEELEERMRFNFEERGISKRDTLIATWIDDYYELLEGEHMPIALLRRYPEFLIDNIRLIV